MKSKIEKHTPGPWRVLEDKRYGSYPSNNIHYYDWIIDSSTRKLMAVLSVPALSIPLSQHSLPTLKEYKQTLREVKANAHLIAAAPDLLTFAQEIKCWLTSPDLSPSVIAAYRHDADIAILKATEGK